MIPQDRAAFLEAVIGLAELKGKQLSAPALELYWRAMQHWCIEDFKQAAQHLVRTCEFMPTPKDFEDLRKAGRPTPGEAWAEVLTYVRRGYFHWQGGGVSRNGQTPPALSSTAVAAVEMLGGFEAIAMSEESKLHFLERRFCDHYRELEDAGEVRAALPQLTNPNMAQLAASAVKRLS